MRLLFDRGTILVDPPNAMGASDLPGVLWDQRVLALRAPAWRYPAVRAQALASGVNLRNEVRPRDRGPTGPWRPIGLRPYQEEALAAWLGAGQRGLVVLPTGSGKTRVAMAAIQRTGLHALCLVPTRVLLHQWQAALTPFCAGAVGRLGDGIRKVAPVTVSTYESAIRLMPSLGSAFDLLIVDEAHNFGGTLREEVLEMSIAPSRLGLTATPIEEGPALARLEELLGPTVYRRSIADLAGRWLSRFEIVTVEIDLEEDERRSWEEDMGTFRPFFREFRRCSPGGAWEDFARVASRTGEGRRALCAWRRARRLLAFTHGKAEAVGDILARHRDGRILVFTADNETAYAISREHLIMPLTCDIGREEREDALSRFRDGRLRALVSCRVLNEGLDVPDADIAVVVGGTGGEREHVQRVGRLLRPAEGKTAIVYELVARGTSEVWQAMKRRRGLGSAVAAPV
ncbi:MAG: DEAD/DEAH box helicase [Deltaproteobacteria bacterium]|nr:DEAD/DEAH box helicase [Deltaproteobacteria bacterium]